MIQPKLVPPRGILHTPLEPSTPGYGRYWPGEALAPFVEHFWTVAWDVPEPEIAEVLPHPSVHLVLEAGNSRVAGVPKGRFTRRLEGKGRVLGTKFRPGGFRPFLKAPVSSLTGRTVSLEEIFGPTADGLEEQALAQADPIQGFEVVQTFLEQLRPAPDPQIDLAARIAERVAADREIRRVEHLTTAFGLGTRTLQRLFSEYVGVSPKWIIQRYRLHEAAERIATGAPIDWPDLALDLGYADQAHFIRDFRRLVGRSPAEYAKGLRSQPAR
ncbi:MAG TPA: helix-turn-helix domain-containing protein [Thermoanaerobaculia bacterium]|nr:helix-turn-helix domain-containing protein [Thermoanaerobaculia bacterium]